MRWTAEEAPELSDVFRVRATWEIWGLAIGIVSLILGTLGRCLCDYVNACFLVLHARQGTDLPRPGSCILFIRTLSWHTSLSCRYAEAHECKFDYKSAGRQQLAKNNPLVQAAKIDKL